MRAPGASLDALSGFYREQLGLDGLRIGETRLEFVPEAGEPFYHLALLVPGDRFGAALEWARERVQLLPGPQGGDVVFDFPAWEAQACYFHDPAGNVIELIAHGGVEESGARGPFGGEELLGVSEVGLVGDTAALAAALREIGLELWAGDLGPEGLAFVGERARTLILCPPGRGWLPTGRPAEPHPVEAVLAAPPAGEASVAGHRIVRG